MTVGTDLFFCARRPSNLFGVHLPAPRAPLAAMTGMM